MLNMKLQYIIAGAALGVVIMFSGCRCGCNLEEPSLTNIKLLNFTQQQVDSLGVTLYNPGTNFVNATSHFIATGQGADSSYSIDIFGHAATNATYDFVNYEPDIVIYIPTDSTYYQITNIVMRKTLCERCGVYDSYINTLASYKLNGVLVNSGELIISR
jgi:hypothetical protein